LAVSTVDIGHNTEMHGTKRLPPWRYELRFCVKPVKELPATTDLTTTDDAHANGFASSRHTITTLRRGVDTSPTAYRQEGVSCMLRP
jgi:AraC-like DNA-binding protein